VISAGWLLASGADIYIIYTLVRRPTMVLDFSLTLILNHTILTTYYASSFPTSLFFWLIMSLGGLLLIVFAEQLCVRREMREGLKTVTTGTPRRSTMTTRPNQEELFNATLDQLDRQDDDGESDGNGDDDSNQDADDAHRHGYEQIELMERGVAR